MYVVVDIGGGVGVAVYVCCVCYVGIDRVIVVVGVVVVVVGVVVIVMIDVVDGDVLVNIVYCGRYCVLLCAVMMMSSSLNIVFICEVISTTP